MAWRLWLFIALRHLVVRRRQTLLTMLGVAVGAMILITTLSMTDGLISSIEETIIESSPHLIVDAEPLQPVAERLVEGDVVHLTRRGRRAKTDRIVAVTALDQRVRQLPGVAATSPVVEVRGILRFGTRFRPVVAYGVSAEREGRIARLDDRMDAGTWAALDGGPDRILIGRLLAKRLGVGLGQRLNLVDDEGRLWPVTVAGIFRSGLKNIDEGTAYISRTQALRIRRWGGDAASAIHVRAERPRQITALADHLRLQSGRTVDSWDERNRTVLASFRRNNQTTLLLVIFTFIVSGFGIGNVLQTVVLEKVRDIAVLRSLGVTRRGISGVFVIEGLIIGLGGGVIGLLAGWGLSSFLGTLPVSFGEASFIQSNHLTMTQRPWFYVVTGAFAVLIAVVASWAPARRAARMMPVAVFRGY